MKKPEQKISWTLLRIILAASALSLVINLLISVALNERLFRKLEIEVGERQGASGGDFAQSTMIDSILSIVQAYYVDPERVENSSLLKLTLENLAFSPHIKLENDGDSYEVFVAGADGQSYEIADSGSLSYRGLLSTFVGLATFLDAKVKASPKQQKSANAQLQKGSEILLNAMLSALDAHSSLMSPTAYQDLKQGTEGTFGGLGVLVGIRDQILTVIRPLPKSPALRAGIKQNDKILDINGKSTYGYNLDELVDVMRGAPGSEVDMGLLKDGDSAPQRLLLKREVIKVESVTSKEVQHKGHNYLHMGIESFSARTSDEVRAAIGAFRKKHQGAVSGLIMDLRSNPGGLLDQAIAVADVFIKEGTIVTTRGRTKEVESAKADRKEIDFPIVILINGESASASEIVAGALQDHSRATLVGEPSFGKGSVQTIFELPGERALKLTIARYYTPQGRSIQNVGIVPDVWLQPIYSEKSNDNLLGMFRYKNELFLRNHLEAISSNHSVISKSAFDTSFKSFYRSTLTHKDALEQENKVDPELASALTILAKVTEVYGNKLPKSAQRSTHWLALASQDLNKTLDDLEKDSSAWLAKKYGVDWRTSDTCQLSADDVNLTSEASEAIVARQGETVEIPWAIENKSSDSLCRVSVYMGATNQGIENIEQLVGRIEAKQTAKGKIKFKIPSYIEPGPISVSLGFATDAVPRRMTPSAITLDVQEKPSVKLRTEVALTDESGGTFPGMLEAGERARIRLRVFNDSNIAARSVKALIQNLSGSQFSLKSALQKATEIPAGRMHEFFVEVEAGKKVFSDRLDLGLSLESDDLLEPLRRNSFVETYSGNNKSGVATSVAH